jgi:hypothetical protein
MSLFPPPDKNGQIKFILAQSLPYKPRMALISALLLAGLGLQLTISFWAGLVLLLAASLLGMVKGYDAGPRAAGGEKWERVTPDEYAKIKLKADQLKKWDEDLFDITNTSGVLMFAAVCVLCAGAYLVLAARFGFPFGYWVFVGQDVAVILAPFWFTGVREYLRKDRLIIKINLLESIMKMLTSPSEVQVFPMLALAETGQGRKEPQDARLLVKLIGAPDAFYGIQVQISINSVQGKDYPYLYCVLIAKTGSGLLAGYERFIEKPRESSGSAFNDFFTGILSRLGQQLVHEAQNTPDAEILVIRRRAEGNTGYSTPPPAAAAIVSASLELAKKLLGANTHTLSVKIPYSDPPQRGKR